LHIFALSARIGDGGDNTVTVSRQNRHRETLVPLHIAANSDENDRFSDFISTVYVFSLFSLLFFFFTFSVPE